MFKRSASISHHFNSAKWQHGLPIMALLFAATMWGISWYPVRYFEQGGIDGFWVSLIIYCGTLIIAVPYMVKHFREFTENRWPLVIIGLSVGWLNLSFILAVLDGQIVRVLLLFYLSPVWATLLSWLVLREVIYFKEWMMLGVAISGAVIMLWSEELGMPFPHSKADWLALSSGIMFAFANMMIRKTEQASIMVKTISGWLGVVVVSGVLIMVTATPVGTITFSSVSLALLYGIFGMTLMTVAVAYGVTRMPLHRSSIILLFEIIIGAVSAVWLANETILPQEWVGGGLVILAAYISARMEIKEA